MILACVIGEMNEDNQENEEKKRKNNDETVIFLGMSFRLLIDEIERELKCKSPNLKAYIMIYSILKNR